MEAVILSFIGANVAGWKCVCPHVEDFIVWHFLKYTRSKIIKLLCTVPVSVWVTVCTPATQWDIWAAKAHYRCGLAELSLTNSDIRNWTCHAEQPKSLLLNQLQALFGKKKKKRVYISFPASLPHSALMSKQNRRSPWFGREATVKMEPWLNSSRLQLQKKKQ